MTTWLVPRDELTPDQLRAIELNPSEHRVIFGPPGSGKTMVLLHRARYLIDRFGADPARLRIFVFTTTLKRYIRSALRVLDLPAECVTTLDKWCYEVHMAEISRRLPWDSAAKAPNFDAIRAAVADLVSSQVRKAPRYDYILVDEGQDLDETAYRLLRSLSKHVTVCTDHKQQIYDWGSSEPQILRALGVRKRNASLLDAFRCSPYIASVAAQFVDNQEEGEYFLRQVRTDRSQGEVPLLYVAPDWKSETTRLADILRGRLVAGERVAILFPRKDQVFGFAKGLRDAGIEVETQKEPDFSSDLPKLMTIFSAKGLTFDTVLMPRLIRKSFGEMADERMKRLLFVGVTRATKWVYLSATQGAEIPLLNGLRPLAERGMLTIQSGASEQAGTQAMDGADKAGDDLSDLL